MYKHVNLLIVITLLLTACSLPAGVNQSPLQATVQLPDQTPTSVVEEIVEPEPAAPSVTTPVQPSPTPLKMLAPKPSPTVEITTQPVEEYRYILQAGTPAFTANFAELDAGCNWMGIGGQVFSKNDEPVDGLIAEVGGSLAGSTILSLALTGGSPVLGPGGYIVKLSDQPIASESSIWIQLFDLGGKPMSERIYFSTFAGDEGCEKNLVIVNFREVGLGGFDYFLPSVFKNGK
jgi:hypothetical protein